jgi:hypothetical protein
MSAPELRAALRAVLGQLDDGVKDSVIDTLMTRGTKAKSGWKPVRPSSRVVEEARSFAEAARHIGRADPYDVTEHARTIFPAPPEPERLPRPRRAETPGRIPDLEGPERDQRSSPDFVLPSRFVITNDHFTTGC